MKVTKVYSGLICEHQNGDHYNALYLSSLREPLAEEFAWMSNRNVSVRYWVTDRLGSTLEQAEEDFLKYLDGCGDSEYSSRYSDLTGYLWTDEWLKVGGHDLLMEFRSNIGKWLVLEITYEDKKK